MGRSIETYNENFDFSWNFKGYGIRTCHEDFRNPKSKINKNFPIELVKYNDSAHSTCFTLAYFKLDEEGYDLQSVGGRLFEEISSEDIGEIWAQLQAAQKMLDAYHIACMENEKW